MSRLPKLSTIQRRAIDLPKMLGNYKKRRVEPDEWEKTIVAISPYKLTDLVHPEGEDAPEIGEKVEQQVFKIRLAHSSERVNTASMLVQRKYAGRGYTASSFQKMPERITLMAFFEDKVIGTLTLGLDSPKGLLVEDLYKAEIGALRESGRKVCELTKLAVDQTHGSRHVLASLFHIAYIYGRVMQGYTDVVIEVNPRHVSFYKRMLGFIELGSERMCSRVNAPAILLKLDLNYVDQQIELLGGRSDTVPGERSLYPYFFAKTDEIGITQRLTRGE